jgi:hypothetical protein
VLLDGQRRRGKAEPAKGWCVRCFSFGFFHDEVVDGPFEAVVCFISCRADSKPDVSGGVLGGTSLFGGKGSILPGAVIGILLVTTIMNGLAMMNASPFIYTIVR